MSRSPMYLVKSEIPEIVNRGVWGTLDGLCLCYSQIDPEHFLELSGGIETFQFV